MIRQFRHHRKHHVTFTCILALLLVLAGACQPAPIPTPTPDPGAWPTWTFMVFLNGDSNLEGAAVDDFLEMAQVGSNDRLNIVVQMDRHPWSGGTYTDAYGDWDHTKRIVIQPGDIPTGTVGIDLQDPPERNMGDPKELEEFIVWAMKNYPADHYILVIWNHGRGWRASQQTIAQREATWRAAGNAAPLGTKDVSDDATDGDTLFMHEVSDALRNAQRETGITLDIVGFDACLMGMIEVAYEIKDYADFMVASEDTEPFDGWPYDTILYDLASSSEARQPENLAKIIVQRYGEFYGPHGSETQSAYDLSHAGTVANAIDHFVSTHDGLSEDDKEWPKIGEARPEIEAFINACLGVPPHKRCYWGVDVGDFATEVGVRVENDDVQEALLGLKLFVGTTLPGEPKFVIANFHGEGHPDAYGVAFYFPPDGGSFLEDPNHHGYEDSNIDNPVRFVQDFQWDHWLQNYFAKFP